jgi:hypothetical protein
MLGTLFTPENYGILSNGQKPTLRKEELQLSLDEFFCLFKRFEVVLTQKGLDLSGRDYDEVPHIGE